MQLILFQTIFKFINMFLNKNKNNWILQHNLDKVLFYKNLIDTQFKLTVSFNPKNILSFHHFGKNFFKLWYWNSRFLLYPIITNLVLGLLLVLYKHSQFPLNLLHIYLFYLHNFFCNVLHKYDHLEDFCKFLEQLHLHFLKNINQLIISIYLN